MNFTQLDPYQNTSKLPLLLPSSSPEEDDWALERRGEVKGGVRVALAGRALAEVADDAQVVLGALEGVRGAGG